MRPYLSASSTTTLSPVSSPQMSGPKLGTIAVSELRNSSIALLGVPIDNVTMRGVLNKIEDFISTGGFHQIATANVDFLINSIHDQELQEILWRCDMILPDGMPLVWASRMMGAAIQERVTGVDLVPQLLTLSEQRGYRIFILGGSEKNLARSAEWIGEKYPQAQIAGTYSPAFKPLEEMDHEEILRQVEAARPDILLVAFGNPKQEKWMAMHRHRLNVPVCVGIGGSFDILAGLIPRAPQWMQNSGMEWLFRTCNEPTRLAKRYIRNAVGLARYMTLQLAATAAQVKQKAATQMSSEMMGDAAVVRILGNFAGGLVSRFESEAHDAMTHGAHVVVDLSESPYIGPDALGALIRLATNAKRRNREFWLTGMRPYTLRLVRATQLGSSFRMARKVSEALRRIEPPQLKFTVEDNGWQPRFHQAASVMSVRAEEMSGLASQ